MNKNETSFPTVDTVVNGQRYEPLNIGLTKREYFAGLAMQSLLLNYVENKMFIKTIDYHAVHEQAVYCVDKLLEQLNQ